MTSTRSASSITALARSDGALAGMLGALALLGTLGAGFSLWEAVGAAALCLPLAWRTRWPLAVLGAVGGGAVVYLTFANPQPAYVLPVGVAAYTVAAHGWRRRTLAVGAGLIPSAAVIAALFSPDDGSVLQQTFQIILQIGFALAVGEAVRSRRALIASMRERTEQAAREHELETQRRVGDERVRIARDVHDVVAHSLATISTQASVGVHVGRDEPERAVEVLEAIKEVSAAALHDLRSALGTVRDDSAGAPTTPAPSLQDVPGLVGKARDSGLSVVLRIEGSPAGLPTALQVAIYRIVQEGLTNVMRHAGGAKAMVLIAVAADQVEVDVTDDGSGQPTAASGPGSGSGLIGMRERAGALGGAFESGRSAGGGFRVRAVLPVDKQPA